MVINTRKLRTSIKKAKIESWNELIVGIEEDPWGLPYKLVLGKLRQSAPMLTETLSEKELEELLKSLFPQGEVHDPVKDWIRVDIPLNETRITSQEVKMALKKGNANKAPGPDE